jgi:hypothetical protein
MDQELKARLDAQDEALKAIYASTEKTRKYFMWLLIGSAAMFILPLLGLLAAIPSFLSVYSQIDTLGL